MQDGYARNAQRPPGGQGAARSADMRYRQQNFGNGDAGFSQQAHAPHGRYVSPSSSNTKGNSQSRGQQRYDLNQMQIAGPQGDTSSNSSKLMRQTFESDKRKDQDFRGQGDSRSGPRYKQGQHDYGHRPSRSPNPSSRSNPAS